jgi:hypothetical protein
MMFLAAPTFCQVKKAPEPELSKSQLTDEQLAVYRAFLKSYTNGSDSTLNISARTLPFDASRENGCLKGIELVDQEQAAKFIHELPDSLVAGTKERLVDPEKQRQHVKSSDPGEQIRSGKCVDDAVKAGFAAGLFSFSEIVFDRKHEYATFSFSFVCGSLCGHGGTVVFRKKNGIWQDSGRRCGSWIS